MEKLRLCYATSSICGLPLIQAWGGSGDMGLSSGWVAEERSLAAGGTLKGSVAVLGRIWSSESIRENT